MQPDLQKFIEVYNQHKPQIVWSEHLSDIETPVSALLKLRELSPYHLLYESVEGGESRARYSIIALKPDILWKCENRKSAINDDAENSDEFTPENGEVFNNLRKLIKQSQFDMPPSLPPMASGIFGYMGYDMVKLMEKLPDDNPDNINIPDSIYMRPTIIVIFDSVKDVAMICSTIYPKDEVSAEEAYNRAKQNIELVEEQLNSALKRSLYSRYYLNDSNQDIEFKSHLSKDEYCNIVEKAKEYIRAGDVFQIVPSRRSSAKFEQDPISLYRSLRNLNPSPYLFYLNMDGFNILGSSPEILVKLEDDKVTIRPIAGTRKRGTTKEEDIALEKELLADKKELAEHLMLLDLGRNDAGRVSQDATVKVTEQMIVERYSHVMHIVSNVEGKLKENRDGLDVLIAGFPAGTVSGAPKIRAMEIIDELEHEKRSFYSGTVGYFGANGDVDTCIALRTALVKDKILYVQAGGGVVADSSPEAEFEETENKSGAVIAAAKNAYKFI